MKAPDIMIIFQGEPRELKRLFPLTLNKIKTNTTNTENYVFLHPRSHIVPVNIFR